MTVKMFHSRRIQHLSSTLSIAAIVILILLASSVICNYSLQRVVLDDKKASAKIIPPSKVHRRIPLNSVSEAYIEVEHQPPSFPPINVTEEERIAWFRKELPKIEIFKSTELTQKFKERADEFLGESCELQFFMTWISPARSFGKREFLAVESVFRAHSDACLMILSETMDSELGNQILYPLINNGFKVVAFAPDLKYLFEGTPAEVWFAEMKKGNKDPGEIPLAQNLSNLLRLAVLYKYGGIYIDTDFIVLKKLSGLKNTIGAQSIHPETGNWTRLNNAILIFERNHPLVFKFIEEFSLTFDGNKWGHNGPYLVSRVVERVRRRPGYEFTVLPPMAFYPVSWSRIDGFFKKARNVEESKWVAAKLVQLRGETYGVHLWNKQSKRLSIDDGSIIGRLLSENCVLCEGIYSS